MRKSVQLLLILFHSSVLSGQPVITSFAPQFGPIGTSVTITGSNFDSNPTNNIVFFGAVKGVITDANSNFITAIVPTGITFEPIRVISNGLTAFSDKPFNVSYSNAILDAESFALTNTFDTKLLPQSIINYDLDGDGKSDIIVSNRNASLISVYKNTGNISDISFSPTIDLVANQPYLLICSDINGDGKPEIISSNFGSNTITVYENLSSIGNINFSPGSNFVVGFGNVAVSASDLDSDGKTDIVACNYVSQVMSILRNTSTVNSISFASSINLPSIIHSFSVQTADLNSDTKPEIIVANYDAGSISIWQNQSTMGNISMGNRIDINIIPNSIFSLTIGDLNNDNKPEIATLHTGANKLCILKNTGSAGVINFINTVIYSNVATAPQQVAISDINGDLSPDLIFAGGSNDIGIMENIGQNGSISFASPIKYEFATPPFIVTNSLTVGDFNIDGKPDIASCASRDNEVGIVTIFTNKIMSSICQGSNISFTIPHIGNSYQWEINDGNGYSDASDNVFINGSTSDSIILLQPPADWYGYTFRCKIISSADTLYSQEFILKFGNKWTGILNNEWENPSNWSCNIVPDLNTDVIITNGTCVLNSNTTIRSLILGTGVSFTINTGIQLTIIH